MYFKKYIYIAIRWWIYLTVKKFYFNRSSWASLENVTFQYKKANGFLDQFSVHFGSPRSEKVPDFSHLRPIWPTLGPNPTSLACTLPSFRASLDDIAYHRHTHASTTIVTHHPTHCITSLHLFKLVPKRWSYASSTVS